jgi:hypothetical protein
MLRQHGRALKPKLADPTGVRALLRPVRSPTSVAYPVAAVLSRVRLRAARTAAFSVWMS